MREAMNLWTNKHITLFNTVMMYSHWPLEGTLSTVGNQSAHRITIRVNNEQAIYKEGCVTGHNIILLKNILIITRV